MPITYGGGIKNISDIENLNRIGVEKYLFKYTNDFDISFLKEVSSIKGQQSIVLHIPFIKIQDKILLKKKFFFNKYLDMDKLKKISKFAGEIVFTDVTRGSKKLILLNLFRIRLTQFYVGLYQGGKIHLS